MVSYTQNHDLQLFADNEEPWEHRTDFQTIDTALPIIDTNSNRFSYTAKTNAMFLASDTGDLYIGTGSSWNHLGAIGSGGVDVQDSGASEGSATTLNFDANLNATVSNGVANIDGSGGGGGGTGTEGIESTGTHVGPMRQGSTNSTDGCGVAFWAESGLTFESAVVHTDLSAVSTTTLTVELAHYEGGAANPQTVGTVDVTVSGGPERIDLSGLPAIPSNGEYVLARRASPNAEVIPCWRIADTDFGTAKYNEHTYPRIDFLRGTNIAEAGDFGAEAYYYYFFDIAIGPETTQVTSPWSTDVDEIYMRPTDPEDEFDQVSPRALWIDTSS